jgi:hypothetical protein
MEYLIGLIFLVVREIFRRYFVWFIIGTIVLTLVVGAIAVAAGGAFWMAAKFTLIGCLAIGLIAGIIATMSAFSR